MVNVEQSCSDVGTGVDIEILEDVCKEDASVGLVQAYLSDALTNVRSSIVKNGKLLESGVVFYIKPRLESVINFFQHVSVLLGDGAWRVCNCQLTAEVKDQEQGNGSQHF